jgi:hypothetical protein
VRHGGINVLVNCVKGRRRLVVCCLTPGHVEHDAFKTPALIKMVKTRFSFFLMRETYH